MSGSEDGSKVAGSGPRFLCAIALAGAACGLFRLTETGRKILSGMSRDIQVVRERDPAAKNSLEVVMCYPGLHALWLHRLSHMLWRRNVPLIPRLISQTGRLVTGVEIHPGATLGEGLFIDHGAGVVIGETAEVGENVTIYQGVTLGGTGKETGKRHPTVGDSVVIGSGSQLLGSIKVGDNVKVGSGSVVVHDVPANSTVVGNPGRPVITQGAKVGIPDIDYTHLPDPVAEAMKCLVRRVVQLENELEELRSMGARPVTVETATVESVAVESETPPSGRSPQKPLPTTEDACAPFLGLDGTPEL